MKSDRLNLRRRRADSITRLMLSVMKEHFRDDDEMSYSRRYQKAFDDITEKVRAIGGELVTDDDREACGLPPRGPDGWTMDELIALEKKRLEAYYPPAVIVNSSGVIEPLKTTFDAIGEGDVPTTRRQEATHEKTEG